MKGLFWLTVYGYSPSWLNIQKQLYDVVAGAYGCSLTYGQIRKPGTGNRVSL